MRFVEDHHFRKRQTGRFDSRGNVAWNYRSRRIDRDGSKSKCNGNVCQRRDFRKRTGHLKPDHAVPCSGSGCRRYLLAAWKKENDIYKSDHYCNGIVYRFACNGNPWLIEQERRGNRLWHLNFSIKQKRSWENWRVLRLKISTMQRC